MRHRTLPFLLAVAVGSSPFGFSLDAQFHGETTVVVVEVPVQVIRDGGPVRGLGADDFELFDGRKRQEITGFEVIDLDRVGGEGEKAA